MTRRNHCDHEELAALYALHALEPDEELTFTRHLPDCRRCREVLAAAERTATHLGEAVPQQEPPARLRSTLLDAIASTPQEAEDTGPNGRHAAQDAAETAAPAPAQPARRRTGRVLLAAAAVLLVAAVVGLGVRVGQLGNERDLQAEHSAEMSRVLQAAEQPGARTAMLKPSDNAKASAVVVTRGSSATLMTMRLQPNAGDKTYVMWGIGDDAKPTAVGTFDVRPDQPAMHTMRLSGSAANFGKYAISLEQGHTAPAEPSNVLAKGTAV